MTRNRKSKQLDKIRKQVKISNKTDMAMPTSLDIEIESERKAIDGK